MKNLPPLFALLFLFPFFNMPAQGDLIGLLNLQGKVIEIKETQNVGVEGARVYITDHGEKTTGRGGAFTYELPIRKREWPDKQVLLRIIYPEYELIEPYDGLLTLDTPAVKVDIYVATAEMASNLREELNRLKGKVEDLLSEGALSRQRLDRLRKTMVDTILHYERRRISYEEEIERMEGKINSAAAENRALRDSLDAANARLLALDQENERLTTRLFEALEEKYRRQQAVYEAVSAGLSEYLLRLKDVRDLLPKVKEYFSSQNNAGTYNATITRYNAAYETVIYNQDAWLEAVQHYWENPEHYRSLQQTLDLLNQQIHRQNVLPSLGDINSSIRNTRINQAGKTGRAAFESLKPLTEKLEQATGALIESLRDAF